MMIFLTTYFVQELFPAGIIQNLLYYSKTRTSVDEVVYDMKVGQLMRDALNAIRTSISYTWTSTWG